MREYRVDNSGSLVLYLIALFSTENMLLAIQPATMVFHDGVSLPLAPPNAVRVRSVADESTVHKLKVYLH